MGLGSMTIVPDFSHFHRSLRIHHGVSMTTPNHDSFRFFHRLRVRWVEVDMQKIVFNGHYLMYFDTAVADYWRALALPYEAAMQLLEGDIFIKKTSVEYHASARYDDVLDIGMKCARVGNSSMLFTGAIFRGNELLITGELLYVFADPATQKSKPVPDALRAMFADFEAGAPMVDIRTGSWAQLGAMAKPVRTEVFIDEQRIPLEMEWDEYDSGAVHAVAINRLGQPVATGRLLQHAPGVSKIGRMAVSRVLRGGHLGKDLLNVLSQIAQDRGDHEICLHAQLSAEGFYTRLGFLPRGEPFTEAGIAHIEMHRPIGAG